MHNLLDTPWETATQPIIVVVEDSDEDFYTFMRVLSKLMAEMPLPYKFLRFQDGDEVLDYLLRQGEYATLMPAVPAAMLLDLNIPGTDGRDVIQAVKQHPDLQMLPIVVLTSSSSPQDIQTCYRYGVNSYILKPMGVSEMQQTVRTLLQYWFHFSALPSHV